MLEPPRGRERERESTHYCSRALQCQQSWTAPTTKRRLSSCGLRGIPRGAFENTHRCGYRKPGIPFDHRLCKKKKCRWNARTSNISISRYLYNPFNALDGVKWTLIREKVFLCVYWAAFTGGHRNFARNWISIFSVNRYSLSRCSCRGPLLLDMMGLSLLFSYTLSCFFFVYIRIGCRTK